ncbi:hypothetical protein SAMN04488498_108113 [Mesorhizobium albiziae]|uniref:Uncharacterized protein n=1 Tax=Neomesorhizobium albiziae TaxID=335020 RepID=A0A1I4ALN2_9HYPH|nr:hypothetical protein [Mesorhizobium albiziae]GLS32908.1 hypothetical protein GCM10007937_46180 [Mesorhizobium albiziae]SFK56669.1 hypothetical protein SAMN04488498_108113 [Mesorhizobium albiziae]
MGSIVSFVPRPAAKIRRSEDHTVAASVIIFPGVRYERAKDLAPESPAGDDECGDPRNPAPLH